MDALVANLRKALEGRLKDAALDGRARPVPRR